MENQIFKSHMRDLVKEYLDIDNEIITLQKAIKERKDRKEKLSVLILGNMKNNDIQQMNVKNEKLVYTATNYKVPINKVYLCSVLGKFFNSEEKGEEVSSYILKNRGNTEKIKLRRIKDKKKNLNINQED
jgi:hypothetical protein